MSEEGSAHGSDHKRKRDVEGADGSSSNKNNNNNSSSVSSGSGSSGYDTVLAVMKSFCENDQDLAGAIRAVRRARGAGKPSSEAQWTAEELQERARRQGEAKSPVETLQSVLSIMTLGDDQDAGLSSSSSAARNLCTASLICFTTTSSLSLTGASLHCPLIYLGATSSNGSGNV